MMSATTTPSPFVDYMVANRTKRPGSLPARAVGASIDNDDDVVEITDPHKWVAGAVARHVASVAEAPDGTRNDALARAAFILGRIVGAVPPLPVVVDDVEEQLYEACDSNGYNAEHADTRSTIRRSMNKGANLAGYRWVQIEPTLVELAQPFTPDPLPGELGISPALAGAVVDGLLAYEVSRQRAQRGARKLLDGEDVAALYRPLDPIRLDAFLAEPDEVTPFLVEHVLPLGANVTVTAAYKAGKTTLVNDLVRALADRVPFLDRYEIKGDPGRIVVANYEVGASQYRRWLRDAGVENTDRVSVLNLRGLAAPLTVPQIADEVAGMLRAQDCGVWIVDPFARAFVGSGDENDNGDVSAWLDTVDRIKELSGVHTFVMPVHTGRAVADVGAERARGATRLDDWADVRWLLTKGTNDKAEVRYFRATGRDVDTDEESLSYDEATRRLHLGGWGRNEDAYRGEVDKVLAAVRAAPGSSTVQLKTATGMGRDKLVARLTSLAAQHLVHETPGPRDARLWTAGAGVPTLDEFTS